MLSLFFSATLLLTPPDTLTLDEAVVVAQPKETVSLTRQPISASTFGAADLQRGAVHSVKHLSASAPNFYMPSYGSRLTSATYVRGVGARIGAPSVGLYVDNVPFIDKTAYDSDLLTAVRVDVLRGPQGTLYGRGSMGGVVRIFTADPITTSGTELSVGASTRNNGRRAAFSTYFHPAERMGLSVAGFYDGQEGFFTNQFTHKKADRSNTGGGRLRWSFQASPKVKIDWTASYEFSKEGACPYYLLTEPATLAQNRPSSYRRHLFNTGLGVEHRLNKFTLTSITAYQLLDDRLAMDQDYTAADIFSFLQQQRGHVLTEEIALKSPQGTSERWTWTTGAFGMYQWLDTSCPVTFWDDGVDLLNQQFARLFDGIQQSAPSAPQMSLAFTGHTLPFDARFRTPAANAAIFHQSTVRLAPSLRATLGVRLDYEHRSLDFTSGMATPDGTVPYLFGIQMGRVPSQAALSADASLCERLKHDSWQVLPKLALTWDLSAGGQDNLYAVVSKGYRSGGYNIQAYSDLGQNLLRRNLMLGVRAYSISTVTAMFDAMTTMPEAAKQAAMEKAVNGVTSMLDPQIPEQPSAQSLYYEPERTWNIEAGMHRAFDARRLFVDISAFYMTTSNQQLARFAASGMGRETINAGTSRSVGAEVALRGHYLKDRLQFRLSYGYTRATFTHYDAGDDHNYTGRRVPFVPEHTFAASAQYEQPLAAHVALRLGADLTSAGEIYWDEANTWRQPFYATLGAHIGLLLPKNVSLTLSGNNLTAAKYHTFAFTSMSRPFAQACTPRHFEAELRWKF